MTYYYNKQVYDTKISVDDEIKSFLQRHEAHAELSRHKLYARRMPVRYNDWLKDGGPIPFEQAIEREPMVEIYMPQDRFRDLVERDRWVGKMEQETQYYKQRYMDEVENDKIRSRNPVVKKAYEQYKMLLELAR